MIRSGFMSPRRNSCAGIEAADDAPARRAHVRVGAVVGEHGQLAVAAPKSVVGATATALRTSVEHALEALVEVDPVLRGSKNESCSTSPLTVSSSMTVRRRHAAAARRRSSARSVPLPVLTAVAPLISVVERFALVAPPARNSVTRPVTRDGACPG